MIPGVALIAVGAIATHEEYPIERIKLDHAGKWLGSVSHDELIKLTDVSDLFEESEDEEDMEEDSDDSVEDMDDKMKKKANPKGGLGDLGKSARDDEVTPSFFDDL
jgi:hypothetical protein